MRKSSKHQAPNPAESGLLPEQMSNPAFFQPMNEQPVLTKRLSQQTSRSPRQSLVKQPPSRPSSFAASHQDSGARSPRISLAKQPPSRPSFAASHQEAPRDLLPMQEMSAAPQWQGRAKRQMSPTPPTARGRKSVSPPPAVVTPPDTKQHKYSQKPKSSDRPKTRKSHRPSTSEQKRTSQQVEVKDAQQKNMHPAVQEHILAELQMAQKMQQQQEIYNSHRPQHASKTKKKPEKQSGSNGPQPEILHPYLQEHIMAERAILESIQTRGRQQQEQTLPTDGVDQQFASFAGNLLDAHQADAILGAGGDRQELHQQLREERLRRHREKKKTRKKGWFGRRSNHSRTRSPDTSVSSDGSGFEPTSPTARRRSTTPPPQSRAPEPPKSPKSPKSIGRRIRNSLLPRRGKHKDHKTENPDAPTTINDPLLQQSIMESIRNMNVTNPSESRGAPARSKSGPQHRLSRRDQPPRTSRRRGQSQSDIPDVELTQLEQQEILNSEIGMVHRNKGVKKVDNSILNQGVEPQKPPAQEHRKHRRSFSQPDSITRDAPPRATQQSTTPHDSSSELKEIAMMFAPNAGESNGVNPQQFVLEQQAALEALQRQQRKREETKKAPPAPPRARAESPQIPPVHPKPLSEEEYPAVSTPPLGLHQTRSELSNKVPPVDSERAKTEMGTPKAAALPAQQGKAHADYCGNSYDGSRSTLPEGEDDFFDWGSVDDPPPIRGDIITRDSFVSEITMPRGLLGEAGEYYSESEEEDFYAENYDSDDYVDDDEWERLEKAMEKGGPEAERQWAEFLKKQGQQEMSGPPPNKVSEVQEQSRPYDGGNYAPSQMVDFDAEDPPPPQVAQMKAPPPPRQTAHIPSPPPPHHASIPSPPPPHAGHTPSSMASVRTTFVCECCAVRKSTREHGHSCDNWDTPHLLCSGCIRSYLETPNAKFRMVEVSNNQTMYQIKCFTALDGTSCNECNAKIAFHLKSIFALEDLESWLVRQRNRLHTMKSASRKHP